MPATPANVPAKAPKLVVRPLTPDRWPDLEAVFEARGCSVARGCWCMYYRVRGQGAYSSNGDAQRARNKSALRALAAQDPPPGLLGYRGQTPVGWVSLGPRQDYPRLAHSPAMKPVDEQPVWSIVCFVVPSAFRRQGVAESLLAGAVAYAARRGVRLLEAYPVDASAPAVADAPWFGFQSMFEQAGFEEVARRKPGRPVMRLRLESA